MKNIFYLTGMFPYDKNPMSGIFICQRMDYIINHTDINLEGVALATKYNPILTRIFKILPEITINKKNKFYKYFNYFYLKLTPTDYILAIFNKGESYKRIAFKYFKILERRYDIYRFNLVHAHFVQLSGFVANKIREKYNIPYIVTAHGSDIHTNPHKDISTKEHTIKTLEEADIAIFVSRYLLEAAKKFGYSGKNASIIPNGINIEIFRPIDSDICRKKIGINLPNIFVIGYVGRLETIKGAHFLPDIFRNIKKYIKNVLFVVVGDGKLKNYIKKKCKIYNLEVIFTGTVNQEKLAILYNAMDVLIVPSLKEGLSCVILEAQACGVPVVGSNIGGIPEAIGGREFGLVLDLGKGFEKRFAEGVIEIIKNRPSKDFLRKRALEFSWDKTIQKEIDIYNLIIKKS